jgi:hypothetical protein
VTGIMVWLRCQGFVGGQCRQAERLAGAVHSVALVHIPRVACRLLVVSWSSGSYCMHDTGVTNSRAVTPPCDTALVEVQGPCVGLRKVSPQFPAVSSNDD